MRDEDGIGGAFKAGEDVCTEVLGFVNLRSDLQTWERFCIDVRRLTLTGQMKYLYRMRTLVIANPKKMVRIQAPTKPSTVFLGESLINCVRPKVMPQM